MARSTLDKSLTLLVEQAALLVLIHIFNTMSGGQLLGFGIAPQQLYSLPFILTAPFIHGSWSHLLNNLFGLTIFSSLCLMRGVRFYLFSSAFIIVVSGTLVWIFGRPAIHIGASGWIFGLWSLSMSLAWFQRKFVNIVIALFVAIFYGGMIVGVLPSDPHISFEYHLFGALAGVLCAYVSTKRRIGRL